jgi:4-aminobutyrate aminotransferase
VVVTAKGLASGFPLSAIAAPAELMAHARAGSQGGTYGGNAVSCAAALATLEVVDEEGLVANADRLGEALRGQLRELAASRPEMADVRGLGLMVGVEFSGPDGTPDAATALRVQQEAAHAGLLLLLCGTFGNVVRLIPALVVTREQVDEAVGIFAGAVEKAASG